MTSEWTKRLDWYNLMASEVVPLGYQQMEAQRELRETVERISDRVHLDPGFGLVSSQRYDA